MKRNEFILMMADILETDPTEIKTEAILFDFSAYDSVCALTLMVRLEDDAKVICSPNELAELKTIGDVESLISRHVGFEA